MSLLRYAECSCHCQRGDFEQWGRRDLSFYWSLFLLVRFHVPMNLFVYCEENPEMAVATVLASPCEMPRHAAA